MRPRAPLMAVAVIVFVFLYLPLVVIAVYSFNASPHSASWSGFTTKWYVALTKDEVALSSVKNSLVLAVSSSLIATFLGTILGYAMHRSGSRRMSTVLHIPICLPDIVQASAMLLFFTFLQNRLGVLGLGMPAMIIAHATFQIPFVALVVRARAGILDASWREAALDLGATPAQTFMHVTLPLLRPGILAGFLLAFTLSLDDFIVSFFTGGAGSTTLPVLIYASVKRGLSPEINALSTLLILAASGATILLTLVQKSPSIPLDESEIRS